MKRLAYMPILAGMIIMLLLAAGCNKGQKTSSVRGDLASQKQDYRQKLENTRDDIDKKIGTLRADLNTKGHDGDGTDGRQEINQQLDNLTQLRNDINDRINRLDNVSQDQWEMFKSDADRTIQNVDDQLKNIKEPSETNKPGTNTR